MSVSPLSGWANPFASQRTDLQWLDAICGRVHLTDGSVLGHSEGFFPLRFATLTGWVPAKQDTAGRPS